MHSVQIYFQITKFCPTFANTRVRYCVPPFNTNAVIVKVNTVACYCLKCLQLQIVYSLRCYFNRQYAVGLANVAEIILFRLAMVYGDADYT